ncbi:AGE family epimerase/isomerase [Marinilabilia rubra]|nr:AGE family epimerase/isomerase [Marinilabilia rubra]
MNRFVILGVVLLVFAISCQSPGNSSMIPSEGIAKKYEKPVLNLIDFFNKNAYDPDTGVYYSEICNSGERMSPKVYNVALSRLIYGLSFASRLDQSYIEKAETACKFQLSQLTSRDSIGDYFISYFDVKASEAGSSKNLDIWQQAYGLCGLVELYRNQPSDSLLSSIHQFHDSFLTRFYDSEYGGFYGEYDLKSGQVSGSKSLQSLIYPVTSYMANLWLADTINRPKYEPYLKENLEIACQNAWNENLGWVNMTFDNDWKPFAPDSEGEQRLTVTPGHNFQFASLFLRTGTWDFLSQNERQKYKDLGTKILDITLDKPIFQGKDLSQGFYSEVSVLNDDVTDYRKTWWQHCEALIALSLANGKYKNEISELEEFYFNHFQDQDNGGEFFYLDRENHPQKKELKGSIGKSIYHTIEAVRFLSERTTF